MEKFSLKNYTHDPWPKNSLLEFSVERFYREAKIILTWKYLVINWSHIKISSQISFSAQHRHLFSPSMGFTFGGFFSFLFLRVGREERGTKSARFLHIAKLFYMYILVHTHTQNMGHQKLPGKIWKYFSYCMCALLSFQL